MPISIDIMLQRVLRHPGWRSRSSHNRIWLPGLLPPWLSLHKVRQTHSHNQGWSRYSHAILLVILTLHTLVCLYPSHPGPGGLHLDVDPAVHGHLGGGYLCNPRRLLPGYLSYHART